MDGFLNLGYELAGLRYSYWYWHGHGHGQKHIACWNTREKKRVLMMGILDAGFLDR